MANTEIFEGLMMEARQEAALRASWRGALAALAISFLLLLAIYHETLFSIVSIWLRSETFTHCFLIFPISGYLVWRRRKALAGLAPRESYLGMASVAVLGFGWLLGNLAEAGVIQQFAFIAMVPALVWSVLGASVAWEISFPLVFLLFSVPFGEFLIPLLIDFTANFTVGMVKLTGIPIYREGTFFSLPSGDWSVVEACSGLRYLIASITLGTLFAYINYRSLLRRAVFIFAASVVPVIANGLRAFMIVMIGHFSGMTLAVGVDHFIYGWVFFGLVMALLFWIGSFWAEEQELERPPASGLKVVVDGWQGRPFLAAVFVLAIAAVWPMRAGYIADLSLGQMNFAKLEVPKPASPWAIAEPMTEWEPTYHGATSEQRVFYQDGQHKVAVFLKYYRIQEQGKELVNSRNSLQPSTGAWKMPEEGLSNINLGGEEVKVLQGSLQSQQQQLLTWRWYWIGGKHTANDYLAKFLEAKDKLLGHAGDEAAIILAVDTQGDMSTGRIVLQNFVDTMLPAIEKSLNQAAKEHRP
ncbi:hypothetical protein MTYM_01747 [Methylococcales bacterium]|nr:hypothetical protein MTYM_01747 [Methylococcales bacterium]